MLGRVAYHDPYVLTLAEARLFGGATLSREAVVERMRRYAITEATRGTPLRAVARHMLGLYHGQPNARAWRRTLSDARLLALNDPALLLDAIPKPETAAA